LRLCLVALLVAPLAGAQSRFEDFGHDLAKVRDGLRISNLSAAIVESGKIVFRSATSERAVTGAPLQQSATAREVMRLVDKGLMSLDDPVMGLPAGATVRRVLSHTADGKPGEEFLYNIEFLRVLSSAVEKMAGEPVRAPAAMEDLEEFAMAPDEPLASGLGWFSLNYSGERVLWDFGQSDKSSTLLVKLPARQLTLIVTADSKALAAAAHLEDGNVVRSSVALAFLEDVVLSRKFERDEMENRAIEAFYFDQKDQSAAILRSALDRYPEMESSDDLTLLRLLSQQNFPETEASATAVIREHPYLPPAWYYYGMFVEHAKRFRESAACFEQITEHRPPWHHWSVSEAKKELSTLQ